MPGLLDDYDFIQGKYEPMQTATKAPYTYWHDGEFWIGYLEQYPDYMTQGISLEELEENLADLFKELTSGPIPSIQSAE